MKRYFYLCALAVVLCSPAVTAQSRVSSAFMPTCTNGAPWTVFVVDAPDDTDCDTTPSGAAEAECRCLDGVIAAVTSGVGGGLATTDIDTSSELRTIVTDETGTGALMFGLTTTMEDGLTCSASQVVRRNAADTAFECATPSGGAVIFDIGDDGGNDSTALTELSTVNDDYAAITEASADEAQIDFAKIPPYQQYDPDRPPSSCATCDEFTGGFQQTWTWGNQGSATDVVENDMAKITGPGAVTGRVFSGLAAPTAGTDFTVTAKIYPGYGFSYSNTDFNSLWVLDTGTLAAPTKFYEIGIFPQAHYITQMYVLTMTGFNTWSSTQLSFNPEGAQSGMYLQWRYVAAAKDLYVYFSINGRIWTLGASYTMTNHPSYVGRSNTDGTNPAYWEFFRIRTDANRNLAGE